MYLARKEGIFGNISSSRVLIKREDKQPCNTDYNTQRREVRRDLEDAGILAEREKGSFTCQHSPPFQFAAERLTYERHIVSSSIALEERRRREKRRAESPKPSIS
jgi:hypothetical protein